MLTDWFENAYLHVAGPDNYDRLARHELPWTDHTVVQTLQLLADYWRTARFVQGGPSGAIQVTFTQGVADVFGQRPTSAMIYEGDFVASEIKKLKRVQVGAGARFFSWPPIDGSGPAVVTAGDQAVAFTDTPETNALMAFLASPDAAAIMAARGGFLSPNRNLDAAYYPDDTTRSLAAAVINAKLLRFDLSDLTPQAFGAGSNAHMWVLLQRYLSKPIPAVDMARQLEEAATKDFGVVDVERVEPAGEVLTWSKEGPDRRVEAGRGSGSSGRRRARSLDERRLIALAFLGPAALTVLALVGYPIVYTIWSACMPPMAAASRSGQLRPHVHRTGDTPSHSQQRGLGRRGSGDLTTLGLIFAVLTERVRRSTALKVILFMPMAILPRGRRHVPARLRREP